MVTIKTSNLVLERRGAWLDISVSVSRRKQLVRPVREQDHRKQFVFSNAILNRESSVGWLCRHSDNHVFVCVSVFKPVLRIFYFFRVRTLR